MTDDDHAVRLRDAVMDALCGYGEAMFLKGNPHNKPDQRLDQKAVWAAIDQAIRYHEAKARVDDRGGLFEYVQQMDWGPYDVVGILKQALFEAEAALAAIIKEIDDA